MGALGAKGRGIKVKWSLIRVVAFAKFHYGGSKDKEEEGEEDGEGEVRCNVLPYVRRCQVASRSLPCMSPMA